MSRRPRVLKVVGTGCTRFSNSPITGLGGCLRGRTADAAFPSTGIMAVEGHIIRRHVSRASGDRAQATTPHWVDVHIGGRIRALRKRKGLSQGALGSRLGLSFQQIQKYERGSNRVSVSTLYEISAALEVPLVALFEGLPCPATNSLSDLESGPPMRCCSEESAMLLEAFSRLPRNLRRTVLRALKEVAAEQDDGDDESPAR